MDGNQAIIRKSTEQMMWRFDDQWGSGIVRSYTCSFCNKCFSNAQALGGHMNIHRKDRAKLREASDENLLSLDISKSMKPADIPHQDSEETNPLASESMEEESNCLPKTPFSAYMDLMNCPDGDEDKKMQLSHRQTTQVELDLELRLGLEPYQASSTMSTREFF
ncbi:transcriptional regulator TAC1 [Manihot esculenta]|uniref:C2H2-type domain-containing protein n=1 Tax=Manihot esculenta TaxID=3983 RepID=A0A2C9V9D7_MANES|nr:transcriptional regulator TAC1 [Manihot esculenta]OAY41357.1 hypothetical protein MANES_09G095200v8 [Manihot esculenta]